MLNWSYTKRELKLANLVAVRAHLLDSSYEIRDVEMDVLAVHCNGCHLDLEKLLTGREVDFGHDVFGIRAHLDRTTGKLQDCFDPRCSISERRQP